jgi:hypothetical protein
MGTGVGALRRLYAVNGTLTPRERVGSARKLTLVAFWKRQRLRKFLVDSRGGGGYSIAAMKTWTERRALALQHVISGRRIIERQRSAIAQRKAVGADTSESERLLENFEKTQMIFEQDLADLDRRKPVIVGPSSRG